MGDFGSKRGIERRRIRALAVAAVVLTAVVLAACGSASSSAPATATSGSGGLSSATAATPVEIRAVELRDGAPGSTLTVVADAPLIWTSFRDPEGRLVVELPNSVAAAGVEDLLPAAGLVDAVRVEQPVDGDGPLTRLVVSTRREVEHAVAGEGRDLEIRLTPVAPFPGTRVAQVEAQVEPAGAETEGSEGPTLAYEPLPMEPEQEPEELPVEEPAGDRVASTNGNREGEGAAPARTPRYPTEAGTAEDPFVAPPPTGPAAASLEGVAVSLTEHGTEVRVRGDGQFAYSTFALDEPHRFVIDLDGVVDRTGRASVPVGGVVQQVRIGQFRSAPLPVSRVVFDLDEALVPRIERTGDALVVDFGELNGNRPAGTRPAGNAEASAVPAAVPAASPPRPATPPANGALPPAASPPQTGEPEAPEEAAGDEASMDDLDAADEGVPAAQPPEVMEPAPPEPDGMDPEPGDTDSASDRMEVVEETAPQPEEGLDETPIEAVSDLDLYGDQEGVRTGDELEIDTPEDDGAGDDPFSARTLAGGEREYVGELMSFSLREADLVETLRSFAVMADLNIVIQPGVSGTVTVELNDVPWDQAFEQILKINGLSYEVEGNIMRIAPTELLSQEAQRRRQLEAAKALSIPLTTVIRRLSYAQAGQVASLLAAGGGILSQRGSVLVDNRTNTLIIKELPDYIDTVIAVIENLDIPEPLVMIEARIVETRKNFTRTLGVRWGFQGISSAATGNTTGLEFPNQGTLDGGVELLTGGQNAFIDLSLGNVLNTFNLDAALQAAESDGLVNILSAPKVQALNNEQATIQSGFQIPIQTVANNTVSVQFVNATLRLDVTPQVTAEGTVLMDINIQKRNPEFGLTVAGAANAPISTKEASTRVIVRDGGTTVIGGIYEVTTNQGEDRVPGLANIPILGHLFKNKRRTDENSELLIFITPRVVKL